MGRGSTKELLKKVIASLSDRPKNIKEIATDTGLDRTAISKYLLILKNSEILDEHEKGTSKEYSLKPNFRTDTYFGLPVREETMNLIHAIYAKIRQSWHQHSSKKLFKTHAQKIMYKIVTDLKLDVPVGWYVYGGICVVPYDDNKEYELSHLSNEIDTQIDIITRDFSKNNFAWQSKQYQYQSEANELYSVKEKILKLLYSNNFSKNSMYVFQKDFNKLTFLAPKYGGVYELILNKYGSVLVDITQNWENAIDENDDVLFSKFKQKLINSFEALWKLIALINFKMDLEKRGFFSKKVLNSHFELDIVQQEDELKEICSELQAIISTE